MNEILLEVSDIASPERVAYVGMAVGYVAGLVMQRHNVNRAMSQEARVVNDEGYVDFLEEVIVSTDENSLETPAVTFKERVSVLLRNNVAPMAAGVGLFATANVLYPATEEQPRVLPTVQVVVDHSATASYGKGEVPATLIDRMTDEIGQSDRFNSRATISGIATIYEVADVAKVSSEEYIGAPDMVNATVNAVTLAAGKSKRVLTGDGKTDALTVVITAGHDIGDAKSITRASSFESETTRITYPVIVVDAGKETSGAVTDKLKKIAKQTNGAYFGADTKPEAVLQAIEDTLVDTTSGKEPVDASERLSWAVVAGMSGLIAAGGFLTGRITSLNRAMSRLKSKQRKVV